MVTNIHGGYNAMVAASPWEPITDDEIDAIITRAAESAGIVSGRPTMAGDDARKSWTYSDIIPRQNTKSYTPKQGRDIVETLRLVIDRDPDASMAVSNFMLLMGNGYHPLARKRKKGGVGAVDERGTAYLNEFDERVGTEYGGGMDAVVNVLNHMLIWQGAQAVEIELSDDLSTVVDVHPVDPQLITFQREQNTKRLQRGFFDGQGKFVELSPRQFRYIPYHPMVGNYYGRSPILAACTAIFFKVQLLEDLRAVVHNQGHPRLNVTVVLESLRKAIPLYLTRKGQEDALRKWVEDRIGDVAKAYKQLKPDDSFVHGDNINVDYVGPNGSVDFKSLSEILDAQIVAGLKQLPIMLGRNEGNAQSHASIQWQIIALEINSMRRVTKRTVEFIHTTALEFAGMNSRAECNFEPLRTSDRKAEAEARKVEIENAFALADRGWIDENEGANEIVGHDAVAEPRVLPSPTPEPEPGEDDDTESDDETETERMVRDGKGGRDRAPQRREAGGRERPALSGTAQDSGDRQVRLANRRGGRDRHEHPGQAGNRAGSADGSLRLRVDGALSRGGGGFEVIVSPDMTYPATRRGIVWPEYNDPRPGKDTASHTTDISYWKTKKRADGIPDHEAILDELIDSVLPEVEARWRELGESYPGRKVANGDQDAAEWFDTDAGREWLGAFRVMLTDHYKDVFDVRGNIALDELGIEGVFRLENPEVIDALNEFGLQRVTGMTEVTIEQLRGILADGLANGDHPSVIARAIRAHISGMSGTRAETIARTETAEAYGRASVETYRRNGVKKKSWLTANDGKVDAPCPGYQDEGIIGIDERFGGVHDYPPAHPRCRCAIVPEIEEWGEPDDPWLGQ